MVTVTIQNSSLSDCNHPNLGMYESYATVNGVETGHQFLTYYNSRCSGISTCAQAMSFCPSTGGSSGGGGFGGGGGGWIID